MFINPFCQWTFIRHLLCAGPISALRDAVVTLPLWTRHSLEGRQMLEKKQLNRIILNALDEMKWAPGGAISARVLRKGFPGR